MTHIITDQLSTRNQSSICLRTTASSTSTTTTDTTATSSSSFCYNATTYKAVRHRHTFKRTHPAIKIVPTRSVSYYKKHVKSRRVIRQKKHIKPTSGVASSTAPIQTNSYPISRTLTTAWIPTISYLTEILPTVHHSFHANRLANVSSSSGFLSTSTTIKATTSSRSTSFRHHLNSSTLLSLPSTRPNVNQVVTVSKTTPHYYPNDNKNTPKNSVGTVVPGNALGIGLGVGIGSIAAMGLLGLLFLYRKKNQDILPSSNNNELNTKWRPHSFMNVVASVVAKLPRSPSQKSKSSANTSSTGQ